MRSRIFRLPSVFMAGMVLCSFFLLNTHPGEALGRQVAQTGIAETGLAPNPYNIGSPTLTELWVSPAGNDSNSGLTSSAPLKTLTAAWAKIPATLTATGYRINLLDGTYPCEPAEPDNCQNAFRDRPGTYAFPIIIRAYNGPNKVVIRGGMDVSNVKYFYLMDVKLAGGTPLPTNASGNNLLHLASVNHVLLRSVILAGPNCAADTCNNLQETLKVNQAKYLYVENSIIGGAWHSSVDYFAVQYGHFINNVVQTAGQWCMYIKGGTSYLRIEGNEYRNCLLGFSAGQSANYPMMVSPWLHYEVYDIKFINNILHDLPGTSLSVSGGYNVLVAYNTFYHIGYSTSTGYPLFSMVRGERGCNPTDELPAPLARCNHYNTLGGWGPNFITDNVQVIPSRNVYIYNNIFYNPLPAHTMYTHFDIWEPFTRPVGFPNIATPIRVDVNLRIRGNVIWNGDVTMPLGIEGSLACTATNATCNETQIRADNAINTVEPLLVNPAYGNFHPLGSWSAGVSTYTAPDFTWVTFTPTVPAGNNSNTTANDFENITRASNNPPGAYYTVVPVSVLSIKRVNASPTTSGSVDFVVKFSETVTGVATSDFVLTQVGVTNAFVSGVSGSGDTYTVNVNTGLGSGTLRLDLVDDDSILDSGSNPLGGVGIGNGNFTTGEVYIVHPLSQTFLSTGAQDGWILESTATSGVGGPMNNLSTIFRLGDDATNRQYRAILHFNTSSLGSKAVIVSAKLQIKQMDFSGSNPFTSHGLLLLDVRKPYFGAASDLAPADFQVGASLSAVSSFGVTPVSSWYTAVMPSKAFSYLNLIGTTQFRLRFRIDSDNDAVADYVRCYSGDGSAAAVPKLIVQYYVLP